MSYHQFDTDDAVKYGVDKAIIIANMRFWLSKNKANKKHLHDSYYWTYNSAKAFAELFPYFTESKIQRLLKSMEDDGLIITGNYNKVAYDRTKWFTMPEYCIQQNDGIHSTVLTNGIDNNVEPIPYFKPVTKPDVYLPQPKAKAKKYKFNSFQMEFAEWMHSKLLVMNPNIKKPNLEMWANTFRLIFDVDKRDSQEVGKVFEWANQDDFWSSNILSPAALRRQYDKLVIKMSQQQNTGMDAMETISSV